MSDLPNYYGAVAEFDSVPAIYAAAETTTNCGYTKVDAHTPFPIHGLDKALRQGESILGWLVVLGGIAGIILAQWLQWWTNAYVYPTWVSGKLPYAWETTIPVTFELMVLCAGICAVFGMLFLNGLPRLHHPFFSHTRAHRVTDDRFFLSIEASDPKFDSWKTVEFLEGIGGINVELLED